MEPTMEQRSGSKMVPLDLSLDRVSGHLSEETWARTSGQTMG